MGKKRYRPNAEGAIYDRRIVCTSFEPPPAVNPVADSQSLALDVLRHFYGDGVTIEGKYDEPHMDGERLGYPPLDEPDVLSDAVYLLQLAHNVITLQRHIETDDPRAAHIRADLIRALIYETFKMGQWQQRVAIRWEGDEHRAYVGKTADKNLAANRQGEPMTEPARAMFAEGASIRKVSKACFVGYQIARRWKKEFLKSD